MAGRVHQEFLGCYCDKVTKAEAALLAAREGATISSILRTLIAKEAAKPVSVGALVSPKQDE